MIKFFRHIRKSLLSEGKTAKYFKYAIGEIILVVIGILIALQINNWNEEKKGRTELNQYLSSLKENIKNDVIILDSLIQRRELTVKYCKKEQLNFLNKTFNLNDTQYALNAYVDFYFKPNTSAYDALKNSTYLGKINGTDLNNLVIDYYAKTYQIAETEKSFNKFLESLEAQQAYNYDTTLILVDLYLDSEELKTTKTTEEEIYEVYKELHKTAAYRNIVSQAALHDYNIIEKYIKTKNIGLKVNKETDNMINN